MRSSVTESHPSPGNEVRSSSYAPPFQHPIGAQPQSRTTSYQHRPPNSRSQSQQPQGRARLAPTEGWLAMALLAVAVYSVIFSIISSNEVQHSFVLLWSTAI